MPPRAIVVPVLLAAVVAAAGGYLQLTENVFWCGLTEAWPQTPALTYAALAQCALFLVHAAGSDRFRLYRLSQLALLPLLAWNLGLLAVVHPGSSLLFGAVAAIPIAWRFLPPGPTRPAAPVAEVAALFVTAALAFFALAVQPVLTWPGGVAQGWQLALAGAIALLGAWWLTRAGAAAGYLPAGMRLDLERCLPLAILLLAVLRAKFPDEAYDSFMYKATLPLQIADWRTAQVALPDGFMVGTNLQELLVGALAMVAPDFHPSLVSTLALSLAFFLAPVAFPYGSLSAGRSRAVLGFAALASVTLTETAMAQGLSFQEPLILLFLLAATIRSPLWPFFLALAALVKINAAVIGPVLLVHHLWGAGLPRRALAPLALGVLLAAGAVVPHGLRNVELSGRILGLNEILAPVTDPPGPHQILAPGGTRYDERPRGGIANNAFLASCNMLALKRFCPTEWQGSENAGFHLFPGSRSFLFALCLLALAAAFALLRRGGARLTFAALAAYLVSATAAFALVSEGRYFLPLSFGFALLVGLLRPVAEEATLVLGTSRVGAGLSVGFACLLLGSNLLPGVFTNMGWNCRRSLTRAPVATDFTAPRTELERFVAERVRSYRAQCSAPGLPPLILFENDLLNTPYLGAHRIFHVYTREMLERFFAADPARRDRIAQAVLVYVGTSEEQLHARLGNAAARLTPCFEEGGFRAFCSAELAPATRACAQSLMPGR